MCNFDFSQLYKDTHLVSLGHVQQFWSVCKLYLYISREPKMSHWTREHSVLLSQLLDIVVGTEETVEIRRDLCKIADSIDTVSDDANSYLTGSCSEGLSLPGSDTDKMSDMNVEVIQQDQAVPQSDQRHLFVMVTDNVHPAFARLRKIVPHTQCAKECLAQKCLRYINGFQFLSSHLVLNSLTCKHANVKIQGPSREHPTDNGMVADLCHFVFSLFRSDITKAP